jgi:hypothetical protein
MGFGDSKAAAGQQEKTDEYASEAHGVPNYMILHQKGLKFVNSDVLDY